MVSIFVGYQTLLSYVYIFRGENTLKRAYGRLGAMITAKIKVYVRDSSISKPSFSLCFNIIIGIMQDIDQVTYYAQGAAMSITILLHAPCSIF